MLNPEVERKIKELQYSKLPDIVCRCLGTGAGLEEGRSGSVSVSPALVHKQLTSTKEWGLGKADRTSTVGPLSFPDAPPHW